MPEIRVEAADGFKGRFPLVKDQVRIGRSRDCDILLPDLWLSRHHAEIRQKSGSFFLRDLGSMNGTRLNGERIEEERQLRPGDVISLAEYVLTFCEEERGGEEEDAELPGTQAFLARDLSDLGTRSGVLPAEILRQQRTLAILTRAATALLSPRPLEELYQLVLRQLFEAVRAQRGAVVLLEGQPPGPVVVATRSRRGPQIERVSRSIVRRVVRDRVSLLVPRVFDDPELARQESVRSAGVRSAMCAPLWISGASREDDMVIGLIYLDTVRESPPFTEEDLRILTALANLAAAKIESARLQTELLEKRRLETDLRKAAEIQSGFLPSVVPQIVGYDLAGCNRVGSGVGADYYDFVLDRGELLFALGDVAGKGTSAALLMSLLRTAVRAHWTDHAPGEAAAWINRTLCQSVPENRYATVFVARLEPKGGHLTYVNAGHYAPLLIRSQGQVERLQEGGTILGMFPSTAYSEGMAELRAGDALVVFSDGVAEAANVGHEAFGEARLAEVACRARGSSAAALQEAILRGLEDHAGDAPASDDRTLIVLTRL